MPGVSSRTTCACGRVRMPTIRVRVVCGRGVTIATFWPTSAFSSVDFPTFGRPTMTAVPARWDIRPSLAAGLRGVQRGERGHRGRLLRELLAPPRPPAPHDTADLQLDDELLLVVGPALVDERVHGRLAVHPLGELLEPRLVVAL